MSQLTYYKVRGISVKVMRNPAAVSASKVRAITSILVAAISEAEKSSSYFWSKPRQEENQSLAAAICTVILFGQPVASSLEKTEEEKHRSRRTSRNLRLIEQQTRARRRPASGGRVCWEHAWRHRAAQPNN